MKGVLKQNSKPLFNIMNVVPQKILMNTGTLQNQMNQSDEVPSLKIKLQGENDYYVKPFVRWAFYGFVATIPFETVDLGIPFETTMISLGILFISLLTQPSLVLRNPPLAFIFFSIYLFVLYISFVIKTPPELFFEAAWKLMVITQLIVMSWVAFNIFKSERVARRALLVFALSCAFLAVLQQLGISQSMEGVGGEGRVTALGFHPNNIARILSLALLSLAGLVYAFKKSALKSHFWVWIVIALLGVTIVQTGSRGGLLALGAGLSIFIFKPGTVSTKVRNIVVVLLGFIFFLAIVFQSETSLSRFETTIEEGNFARREKIYPTAWEMIKEKPILGWGKIPGEYELGARLAHPEEETKNAHNLILYVLVASGLIGFIPLVFGVWLTVKTAWKTRGYVRGVLPLSLLTTVLVANMSGVWINNKMHWIVTAYALSSIYVSKGTRKIYLTDISHKTENS